MSEGTVPDRTCSVDGCDEPAAITLRGAAAAPLVDKDPAELVPLCARHAEQAEAGRSLDES